VLLFNVNFSLLSKTDYVGFKGSRLGKLSFINFLIDGCSWKYLVHLIAPYFVISFKPTQKACYLITAFNSHKKCSVIRRARLLSGLKTNPMLVDTTPTRKHKRCGDLEMQ